MNILETGTLLAKIQAFDNRNVDNQNTIAWQEVLERYTLADCVAAVLEYYTRNSKWLMPSDVIERVKDIEASRIQSFRDDLRLTEADDRAALDGGSWSASYRRLHRAAATGELSPADYASYQAGNRTLDAVLGQKAIR